MVHSRAGGWPAEMCEVDVTGVGDALVMHSPVGIVADCVYKFKSTRASGLELEAEKDVESTVLIWSLRKKSPNLNLDSDTGGMARRVRRYAVKSLSAVPDVVLLGSGPCGWKNP